MSTFLLMFVFIGCSAVPSGGDSGTGDREDVPTLPTEVHLADLVNQPMDRPVVDVPNPDDGRSMDADQQDVQDGSVDASMNDAILFDGVANTDVTTFDIPDVLTLDVASADSSDAIDAPSMCAIGGDWESVGAVVGLVPGFRFDAMGRGYAARSYADLLAGQTSSIGNYAVAGPQITLSNDNGAVFNCNVANVGRYDLRFNADCTTVIFTRVADDCVSRNFVMSGIQLRRGRGVSDAGVAEASLTEGGVIGMCSIPTDWRNDGPNGMSTFLRVSLMGSWEGAQARANLGGPLALSLGTWALAGNHIILTNGAGAFGCVAGDRGDYIVSFNGDCSQMDWVVVADTCNGRPMAVQRPFVRLP